MTKRNETTSKQVASVASKGLQNPKSLTLKEIKMVSASALTQKVKPKSGR